MDDLKTSDVKKVVFGRQDILSSHELYYIYLQRQIIKISSGQHLGKQRKGNW